LSIILNAALGLEAWRRAIN